jgi:hypothetical protein
MESKLMKKVFLLVLLVTSVNFLRAQNHFYLPDGTKYSGKAKTINQINAELAKSLPVYVFLGGTETDDAVVGYKMFTNKPIWVITKNPKRIQEYILKFSLEAFLHSWEFTSGIEKCIKERTLTDRYLLQSLGKPDKKITLGDATTTLEEWQYHSLSISLFLTNGVVTRYLKVE